MCYFKAGAEDFIGKAIVAKQFNNLRVEHFSVLRPLFNRFEPKEFDS